MFFDLERGDDRNFAQTSGPRSNWINSVSFAYSKNILNLFFLSLSYSSVGYPALYSGFIISKVSYANYTYIS